jgi:hypothetical protein
MEQTYAPNDLARFVILRHEGSADYKPGVHWDLMLQSGRSLKTWALAELPATGRAIEAEQLPDHRSAYLDYEGPISGGRGSVHRWDQGHFQIISESAERWIVTLDGRELRGRLVLCRAAAGSARWQCTFEPDTNASQ